MNRESRKESIARHALRLLSIQARSDTLERLHHAIEWGITASSKAISRADKRSNEYVDVITEDECLAIEELLGLAFVAAQFFLTLIRTELVAVNKTHKFYFNKTPLSFFGQNGYGAFKLAPFMAGTKYSVVEAINAIANYWKHSEEWPVIHRKGRLPEAWDVAALKNRGSAQIVIDLGLIPNGPGNLRTAAKALGVKEFDDLLPIRRILSKWAADLLKRARTEFGVKP